MSKSDFVDYYQLLEVGFDATDDIIDRAYRAKIKQHHPDRHGGSRVADEQTKRLIEARGVLKDPAKRKAYHERWFAHAVIAWRKKRKSASRPTAPEPQHRASTPPRPSPPPAAAPPPPSPPPAPPTIVHPRGGGWGVPLGLFTLLGGALLLASNSYDRRVGRYRGSDGTFRSGRFS